MKTEHSKYQVTTQGECTIDSPLGLPMSSGAGIAGYVSDSLRIYASIEHQVGGVSSDKPITLEKAGPRAKIYFRPGYTRAAIVTCGGLSPGLNNVIRSIFMQLYHRSESTLWLSVLEATGQPASMHYRVSH